MDTLITLLIILLIVTVGVFGSFAMFCKGWNECEIQYKSDLASLGYKMEQHYIEKDGFRTNWVELVTIERK